MTSRETDRRHGEPRNLTFFGEKRAQSDRFLFAGAAQFVALLGRQFEVQSFEVAALCAFERLAQGDIVFD